MTNGELQQRQMMRLAGFKLSKEQWKSIRVWERGDLRIALLPNERITVKTLVERVAEQAIYRMRRGTSLIFPAVDYR